MAVEISVTGGDVIEFYNNYIEYEVTLSETSFDAVYVSYRTLRGTATDYDINYSFSSGTNNGLITFAPGETTKTILIESEHDTIDERDEHITLELFNPSANASFAGDLPVLRSTGIILDDDGAGSNLAMFVSNPVITETDSGTFNAVFEILLSQPAPSAFSASYTTSDITAKAGSDYIAQSGSVNFSEDQQVAYVSVPVVGDVTAEMAETFALIVTPPGSPSIGTDGVVGEALILDTDTSQLPELSIQGDVVTEFYNNHLRFTITLSEPSQDAISVSFRTLRGSGVDYDLNYAFSSGTNNGVVTFAPGETSKSVLIEAEHDTADERDEDITLELFNPTNNVVFAGGVPVLRSTGVILDNDGVGSNLAIFVSDPVIVEADSGQTEAVFDIRLSRPASTSFSVDYKTADISAVAGADYIETIGTLTFVPGQEFASVAVPVVGDLAGEAAETFALVLTPPVSPSIGTDGAVGEALILDTDTSALPELSIAGGDGAVEFYNNYIRFIVTLSEPSLDAISVNYRTLRDTAIDYDTNYGFASSSLNNLLTFAPGETTKSIFIEAESDSLDERDENITLELFNPTANVVFAGGTPVLRSTGIIWDNDGLGSNLAVFVSDPVLVEADSGQTEALFDIQLSRPAATTIVMDYTTGDITALAGSDYVATSGTITFEAGQDSAAVRVPVLGDLEGEAAESFALIVTPVSGPSVDTKGAVGEALILDTDTSALTEISVEGDVVYEYYNNYLRFTVSLSEAATDPVNVSYRTLRDTAIDYDTNYGFASSTNNGVLTFAPGETTKSIYIEAEYDTADERDESLTLELYHPSINAVFSGGTPVLRSTGIILDDDGTGSNQAIFVSNPVLVEGNSGSTNAVFEIRLSQPAGNELTVDYTTSDITAVAGVDYVATSGSVTFAPGQDKVAVMVPVLGDNAGEATEEFALIVTPPPSPSIGTDGAVGEATILDTDTTSEPEISVEGDVVYEYYNNYLRYVVTLSEPSLETVTVDYQVVAGDADGSDLDNGLTSGTLTFAPGETTKSLFVEGEYDTIDERDESIHIQLTNPVNGVFPQGEVAILATGFVLDDDGLGPNRALAGTPTHVQETGADYTDFYVDVSMSRPYGSELSFDASLISLTGTVDIDISLLDTEVVFAPGATRAAVAVRVFGDAFENEGPETVELVLTPAAGVPFVGAISNTTITIADGPAPVIVGNSSDFLFGTPGNDMVNLLGGDDTYFGLAGDDVIKPGSGNDEIDGGLGSDTADYSDALGGVAVYLQYSGRNVGGGEGRDSFISIENLTGSAYADRLIGDTADNVFVGGGGNDIIKGKGGDDIFYGGDGDDVMRGDSGVDLFYGEAGSDTLLGLDGNDMLDGGVGIDYLYGGLASDNLSGGDGGDFLRGNRGGDTISGGDGGDDIRGGGNGDVLNGDAGDDFMLGEGGADRIAGGAGDDILFGGFGGGVLDNQRDTFVFASSADGAGGFDRIRDWENGRDVLDLRAFGFSDFTNDVLALATDTGSAMRINFGGGDVVYIDGFSTSLFDASDVIL